MDHWPPMCWVLIASIVIQLSSDVTMLKFCRGISCSGTMHCLVFPEKGYFKDFISYEDLDLPKSELTVKLIGFYWTFRKELFQVQGFLETYWMTYWKSYLMVCKVLFCFCCVNFRRSTFHWGKKWRNFEILQKKAETCLGLYEWLHRGHQHAIRSFAPWHGAMGGWLLASYRAWGAVFMLGW